MIVERQEGDSWGKSVVVRLAADLELGEEHDERKLERAIMLRIEKFLVEMGGRLAFMGRQYRPEVGGRLSA